MSTLEFIKECQEKVFSGNHISVDDAKKLLNIPEENLKDLARCANEITRDFNGDKVDVEQLNNIKKNACSEDCTFCGQSAFFDTGIESYQLPTPEEVVTKAQKAKEEGAESKVGISVECSLGFLTPEQAKKLKELKVKRYNHNLETAKSKFSEICTTHTYEDRLKTLGIARDAGLELCTGGIVRDAGLELCTGGIIGLGETREQRLELTLELARLYPEEVTQADLPNSEIVRMFSVIRFLLPESVIKISGGRETNLDDSGEELLQSGANGIITAGYLTMDGNEAKKDREMIEKIGLQA
jgi:biotin synthase